MKIFSNFNKLLSKSGFQIIRSVSLDKFISIEKKYCELESRINAIEEQSEKYANKDVIKFAMKAHWSTADLLEREHKHLSCPLCTNVNEMNSFKILESKCIFFGGRLVRYQCPNCDVIFGPLKMLSLDEEMLDLAYRNLYQIYSEGNSTDSIIRTFHLLNPKKEGLYLDFGCGESSEAIMRLREDGWNIYGFEPSANNDSTFVFSQWGDIEAQKFDGILSHNVLEHLFDPAGTTKQLANLH